MQTKRTADSSGLLQKIDNVLVMHISINVVVSLKGFIPHE